MLTRPIIITGTDTGIGKTVFAAGLAQALQASYWKPVQSGLEEETDSQCVTRLAHLTPDRLIPEAYRLALPASPHLSAARENVTITLDTLALPHGKGTLVVEGAGGVMVPLNSQETFADLFARWQAPVVLCARTTLGTINHTLLSLEALRQRHVPVLGVAFIGNENPDTAAIIAAIGSVRILGCLPFLESLTPQTLATAFEERFSRADFIESAAL